MSVKPGTPAGTPKNSQELPQNPIKICKIKCKIKKLKNIHYLVAFLRVGLPFLAKFIRMLNPSLRASRLSCVFFFFVIENLFGYLVSGILFKPAVTPTCNIDNASTTSLVRARKAFPIMDYTAMLGPKGVGFSGFRHIKVY